MDVITAPKKKGSKKKNLTDVEKGKMEALLRLKIYTTTEIGEMVGRDQSSVVVLAKKLGIPTIGNSKRSEEYKLRLANMFGDQTERMLESIARMTPDQLDKLSLAQRSLSAGIATDKLLALTKEKEPPPGSVTVNLSWLSLVHQAPARTKDGFAEEAEIVRPENKKIEDAPKDENRGRDDVR